MKKTLTLSALPLLLLPACAELEEPIDDPEFRAGTPTTGVEGDVLLLHPGALDKDGDGEGDGDCGDPDDPDDDDDCDIWDIADSARVYEGLRTKGVVLFNLAPPYIKDKYYRTRCLVASGTLWEVKTVTSTTSSTTTSSSGTSTTSSFTGTTTLVPLFWSSGNKIYAWGNFFTPVFTFKGKELWEGPPADTRLALFGTANLETASTFRKLLIAGLVAGDCGSPGL